MDILIALAALLADPAAPRAVGKLGIVIGAVELKTGEAGTYAPAAAGVDLDAEMFVKTGPGGRAAVDFADGTELRLNENSELHLNAPRKATLKIGTAYLIVKRNEAQEFELTTPFAPLKMSGGSFVASFLKRDPNAPEYKTVSRTETIITVLEGKVNVISRRYAQYLTAGYTCNLVDAQLNTPDPTKLPMHRTRWVHEILVARGGKPSDEIGMRVSAMLDRLGAVEKDDPSEAGLRSLGEYAASGLAQYLKIPSGASDLPRRRAAARVLGDVCPATTPRDLLPLLKDKDAQIRVAGAKGLKRVTGEDLGKDEAWWSTDDAATAGFKLWDEKLKK